MPSRKPTAWGLRRLWARRPWAVVLLGWDMTAFPATEAMSLAGSAWAGIAWLAFVVGAGALITAMVAEGVRSRRAKRRREPIEAKPKPALEKFTARLTDPAPGQCPVCSYDDLPFWNEVDEWVGNEGDERHVVPYGEHEAHKFCAALVPWAEPPRKPGSFLEQLAHDLTSCFSVPGPDLGPDWPARAPYAPAMAEPSASVVAASVVASGYAGMREIQALGLIRPGVYVTDDEHQQVVTVVSCRQLTMPISSAVWGATLAEPLAFTIASKRLERVRIGASAERPGRADESIPSIGHVLEANLPGGRRLYVDRRLEPGGYIVDSPDEHGWNMGPAFRGRISDCTASFAGYIAYLELPLPQMVQAGQSVRPSHHRPNALRMWSGGRGCGGVHRCGICGELENCATQEALGEVIERHRFGCSDGYTLTYAPPRS